MSKPGQAEEQGVEVKDALTHIDGVSLRNMAERDVEKEFMKHRDDKQAYACKFYRGIKEGRTTGMKMPGGHPPLDEDGRDYMDEYAAAGRACKSRDARDYEEESSRGGRARRGSRKGDNSSDESDEGDRKSPKSRGSRGNRGSRDDDDDSETVPAAFDDIQEFHP